MTLVVSGVVVIKLNLIMVYQQETSRNLKVGTDINLIQSNPTEKMWSHLCMSHRLRTSIQNVEAISHWIKLSEFPSQTVQIFLKSDIALFCSRQTTGGWFNIKITSCQHRKSHCGDKTVSGPSYFHNGISYSGKTASLYWIRAQAVFVFSFVFVVCVYSWWNIFLLRGWSRWILTRDMHIR